MELYVWSADKNIREMGMLNAWKVAAAVLASLSISARAEGQFRVDATSPPFGAEAVNLVDTVAFAFNQAVEISTDWNAAFQWEPRDSLRLARVALCIQFTGECTGGTDKPRYARFGVRHQPNTDYTWFVQGVHSSEDDAVAAPFVLRYTTAPTIGEYRASGSINSISHAGKNERLTSATKATLGRILQFLSRREQTPNEFSLVATYSAYESASSYVGTSDNGYGHSGASHTRVLLIADFTAEESSWRVLAGAYADESAQYQVDFVRSGTYWPLAVRYRDAAGEEIEALGYYDPDLDGIPDSITVENADVEGIDLSMFEYPLVTASAYLIDARQAARAYADDQMLVMIRAGDGARPSGAAYAWTYSFYSPTTEQMTEVAVSPLGVEPDATAAPLHMNGMAPIDLLSILDSDAALLRVAEQEEAAFWATYSRRNLRTVIEAANFYWVEELDPDRVYWRIEIAAHTSSTTEVYRAYVDVETGSVVQTSAEGAGPERFVSITASPYPNPFHENVVISFTIERPSPVELTIYNVLGQRIATLMNNVVLPAGDHEARWTAPDVAPGTYFYRLDAGGKGATGVFIRATR